MNREKILAAKGMIDKVNRDRQLQDYLVDNFLFDPLGFVCFIYPWGKGELAGETGPDTWQVEFLTALGEGLKNPNVPVRLGCSAGFGSGKTTLLCWLIHYFMSCRKRPRILATSNTKVQLETTFWLELNRWHSLALNSHWFEWQATRYRYILDPNEANAWYASAIPWNEKRPQAFAGRHSENTVLLFDEASEIHDSIWASADASMTDPGPPVWIAVGNPTQPTGRFKECFTDRKKQWKTWQVDTRNCKRTNKYVIDEMIDFYGEDHDYVRVRVKGQFPRQSAMQFMNEEEIMLASKRVILQKEVQYMPKVMGIDVARHGDDQSAVILRQGPLAYGLRKFRIADTIELYEQIRRIIKDEEPDGIFVDMIGIGAGLYDLLRRQFENIYGVQVGKPASREDLYNNKRTEIWGRMRDWMPSASIPKDDELIKGLKAPCYTYERTKMMRIMLERKEDTKLRMKSTGGLSLDPVDALALTFTFPVERQSKDRFAYLQRKAVYNPYDFLKSPSYAY